MARAALRCDVIAGVARLAAKRPPETVFVGIDGRGGAGKSTLAAAAAEAVPGVQVIHVDDFSGLTNAEWDWHRFRRQVLAPLSAGRAARYQVWDREHDRGGEWVDVPTGRVVIVEGVSSTREEAEVPWALQVWVDAPCEVRLERALERDGPGMMRRWHEDWMPSEEAYVAREQPQHRADLLVSGVEPTS